MLYLLDANVFITAHNSYYPVDTVPKFWAWIAHQCASDVLKMPLEIFEEVKAGGQDGEKDQLLGWLLNEEVKKYLILKEDVDGSHVADCVAVGYASDLSDDEVLQIGQDPFLIAYAMESPQDRCVALQTKYQRRASSGRTGEYLMFAPRWACNDRPKASSLPNNGSSSDQCWL